MNRSWVFSTSPSKKTMKSPVAAARPAAIAWPFPPAPTGSRSTVAPDAPASAAVSSVEPSSTTRISSTSPLPPALATWGTATASTTAAIVDASLRAGITTETVWSPLTPRTSLVENASRSKVRSALIAPCAPLFMETTHLF